MPMAIVLFYPIQSMNSPQSGANKYHAISCQYPNMGLINIIIEKQHIMPMAITCHLY